MNQRGQNTLPFVIAFTRHALTIQKAMKVIQQPGTM